MAFQLIQLEHAGDPVSNYVAVVVFNASTPVITGLVRLSHEVEGANAGLEGFDRRMKRYPSRPVLLR